MCHISSFGFGAFAVHMLSKWRISFLQCFCLFTCIFLSRTALNSATIAQPNSNYRVVGLCWDQQQHCVKKHSPIVHFNEPTVSLQLRCSSRKSQSKSVLSVRQTSVKVLANNWTSNSSIICPSNWFLWITFYDLTRSWSNMFCGNIC